MLVPLRSPWGEIGGSRGGRDVTTVSPRGDRGGPSAAEVAPSPLTMVEGHWSRGTGTGRTGGRRGDRGGAPAPYREALTVTDPYRDRDQASPVTGLYRERPPRSLGSLVPTGHQARPSLGSPGYAGTGPPPRYSVPVRYRGPWAVPGCPWAVPWLSRDRPRSYPPGPTDLFRLRSSGPAPSSRLRELIGPFTARGRKPFRRPRPSGGVHDLWQRRSAVTYGGP